MSAGRGTTGHPDVDLSLIHVTDAGLSAAAGHDVVEVVRAAVAGGVRCIQVREKDAPARDVLATVLRVADALPPSVALFVNDRVDVVLAARAAGRRVTGIHVGQSDLPVELVRRLLGPDALIGLSAGTEAELREAAASPAGVAYVGVGAVHATATKRDAPPPLGHERFARLVAMSALPVVGIGGLRREDLPALREAGAAGAAVVSAICAATDPEAAARELRTAWGPAA